MSRRPALTLLAMFAATLGPQAAQAFASDAASTQSYVQANYRLVQTAASRISVGEAAINNVLRHVRSECPLAAAGSPQDPESTQLSNELIGTMVTSAVHTDLPSIREYLRVAGRLRWSSRGLTSAVQGYVSKLRTMSSLAVPDICADVRSWEASGFKTLPASTVAFDQRFMPAWVALGELPGSLGRYESGEGRSLARRCSQREGELTEFEAREVETWGHIMNALELSP
ncbi:MAG TPA: hypothetical protein VN772_07350 [Solirubrobacteraceae bacterium]|nr:hypothetical protein [Solirubrobacteraceae bacterium]